MAIRFDYKIGMAEGVDEDGAHFLLCHINNTEQGCKILVDEFAFKDASPEVLDKLEELIAARRMEMANNEIMEALKK